MTIEPRQGNVHVFFAGLMVGRLRDHMYELGVLPDAGHEMLICSREGGHELKSWPIPVPEGLTWELRITNSNGTNPAPNVETYNPRSCFDINRQDKPPESDPRFFLF